VKNAIRDKRLIGAALVALVAVITLTLVLVLPRSKSTPPPGASATANVTPGLNAAVDTQQRIVAILTQMHEKAFNPDALPPKNSAGLAGGLFVNWFAGWDGNLSTAPDNTNFTSNGKTDSELGKPIRHDEFTDLIYMRTLLGYRAAHPSDHAFDADIARMEPIVKSDFQAYTYYKCFLYGELVDMARFDPGGGWGAMADTYVRAVYARYYNSALSSVVGNSDGTYRVDFAIECAVAFIDAGTRLHDPGMVSAGRATAQHVLDNGIDPTTHLLNLQMAAKGSGKDTLIQKQVKMGEEAQSLDALLTMYDLTHNPVFLTNVHAAVTWLFASPLHDKQNGGFFFAVDSDGTGLQTNYKESRQAWMLTLLQHLDKREPGQWTSQTVELLAVVKDKLWGAASDGYVYRVTPGFAVYRTHAGAGRALVSEEWVTTEAMDIACQALEGPSS
jgi:hypothetical protein